MKSTDALRILADVTAYQWGMVTSAQASVHGITRLDLSRLAEAGHLERLAHGVYKDAGAPGDQFDDLRAAWLSTDPKHAADVRLKDRTNGVVVAGISAARLHGIGDLWDRRHDFVSPARRQSQRNEIRYRQRQLEPRDVSTVEGLPAMSIECTIADLFNAEADNSHIADALRDASQKHRLDIDRLRELLAPHAKRAGFRKGDGAALLDHLMEISGIDADTLSGRIASTQEIGSRVVAKYLDQFGDLKLQDVRAAQEAMKVLHESFPTLDEAARSQLLSSISPPAIRNAQEAMQRILLDSGATDAVRKATAARTRLPQINSALTPEMMRMVENAQQAMKRA